MFLLIQWAWGLLKLLLRVQQQYLVVPHELHFHMVHRLLREHIDQEVDYKVIVFCTTAMVTEFMYIMLRDLKLNVREIHSRKPQLYRTRISEEFRDSNRLILVTSDVSTRGVNYPDVTLVIQIRLVFLLVESIIFIVLEGLEGKVNPGKEFC
uniref:ATP-dependent RNA helicase n=1 Tax=Aegilops tauschii subsp. strangulata TaxID=200361 RepID=A0A453Q598_AEGTS